MPDIFISSSRRRILKILFGGSLAVIAVPTAYVLTNFILPLSGKIISMIAGNAHDLNATSSIREIKIGMKDVLVMRADDGKYSAIDLKCSHAGCTVHWIPDQHIFRCPCHGGEYDTNGSVIKGPPPRPLSHLQVTIGNNGDIIVTDLPAAVA